MTKLSFKKLKKYFDDNKFPEIEKEFYGTKFLKLRSISRINQLREIAVLNNIDLKKMNANQAFEFLFCNNELEEKKLMSIYNQNIAMLSEVRGSRCTFKIEQWQKRA